MPPRSPTTVGMAVETTVISIAAIERLSSRETTVRGRLVFIVRVDALAASRTQLSVRDASSRGAQATRARTAPTARSTSSGVLKMLAESRAYETAYGLMLAI